MLFHLIGTSKNHTRLGMYFIDLSLGVFPKNHPEDRAGAKGVCGGGTPLSHQIVGKILNPQSAKHGFG